MDTDARQRELAGIAIDRMITAAAQESAARFRRRSAIRAKIVVTAIIIAVAAQLITLVMQLLTAR